MKINHIETGGCLCGHIRYEFNRNDVVSSGHCHCKDCQKITGSGKATIIFIPTKSLKINKEYKIILSNFYIKFRVQKLRFLAFSRGSGGFRELREAGRKHFHLSWYLSVPVVTSYDQKP